MAKTKLSIVIPCYNEENNLKKGVLDEVDTYLKKAKFDWEIIIVNDQSTDSSQSLVSGFIKNKTSYKFITIPHGGKPAAVWAGIQQAKNPIVLFTDMDQSTPLKEIEKILPFFEKGYDIVIGSRGESRSGFTLLRKIGSRAFLTFRKAVMLPDIVDTQCGFKAMRTKIAKEIFPKLQVFADNNEKSGWKVTAYDVELLFIAQKMGYKIKEIPVEWKNEDISNTKGDFGARYKKESIQMAQQIWQVLINNLQGKYSK